jgi:O-antigen biosynthesis protein
LKNKQKVLFISSVFPEPSSSAAGVRTLELIHFFISLNYEIIYASTSNDSNHSINFSQIGISFLPIEANNSEFDEKIKEMNPTIVIYDRFFMEEQFSWRVKENCKQAFQILDTQDLHFLRKFRQKNIQKKALNTIWEQEESLRELAAMFRSDFNLIISQAEMNFLNKFVPELKNIHYFPLLYDRNESSFKSFENRKNYCFIGNFLHEPNRDAVFQLKNEIWPIIRQLNPKVEIHIYGAYVDAKIEALNDDKNGFIVKGRTENAKHCLSEYRVLLAPLRFGAGLKGKIIDAVTSGTPYVSSQIGLEGIDFDSVNLDFTEIDIQTFSKEAITLYENKNLWTNFQLNAINKFSSKFDSKFHLENLKMALQKFIELKQYKNNNIIGKIIQQEQLRSTKYLSKWIEEKNRYTK